MLYEIIWFEAYDPTAPSFLAGLFAFEFAFNKLVMTGDIAAPALPLNIVITDSPLIIYSKLVKQKNGWVFYINPSQRKNKWSYGFHDLVHLLTSTMITHVGMKQDPDTQFKTKPDKLIVKLSKIQKDITDIITNSGSEDILKKLLKRFDYKHINQVPITFMENFLRLLSQQLFSANKRQEAGMIHVIKNDVMDIKQERDNKDNQAEDTTKYTRVHYAVSDKYKHPKLKDSLGGQPQYYVEETIGNSLQGVIQLNIENSTPMVQTISKFLMFLKSENKGFEELFDNYGGQEIVDYILQLMPKFEQLYNSKLESIKKLKPTQLQP